MSAQPRMTRDPGRPRYVAGALAAFAGLSAANVLPPAAQLVLYGIALLAVLRGSQPLPLRDGFVVLLATGYLVLARVLRGLEFGDALRLMRPCIEGFLLAHVLFKWCRIRTFRAATITLGGFILIQFVFALLMALDPQGRSAFIEEIYSDESYQNAQFSGALLFRGYGFSRHHLYGLALACGLSAGLLLITASLERANRGRLAMAAVAAAGLLLVAVNARIGFVPALLCYAIGSTFLFNRFYVKNLFLVAALLLAPLVYFAAVYFSDDLETLWTWLAAGVAQFGSTDPNDVSTVSDLQQMLIFSPNVGELAFGSGRVCTPDEACYSDIGFIRALQEGGLVLLALILWLYWRLNQHIVRLFRRTVAVRSERRRRAAVLLAAMVQLTFVAALIKGEAYGTNDYSRLVATLACLGLLAGQRRRPALVSAGERAPEPVPAGETPAWPPRPASLEA